MVWFGAESDTSRQPLLFLVVYWSIFLVLFAVTILIVLLDLRYIRLQYRLGERAIFRQTLGEEALRKSLRRAQSTPPNASTPGRPPDGPITN